MRISAVTKVVGSELDYEKGNVLFMVHLAERDYYNNDTGKISHPLIPARSSLT